MSKTGVIVIEIPDPPTTDNATDASAETTTSSDTTDTTSKPGKKDKTPS